MCSTASMTRADRIAAFAQALFAAVDGRPAPAVKRVTSPATAGRRIDPAGRLGCQAARVGQDAEAQAHTVGGSEPVIPASDPDRCAMRSA